MRTKLYSNAFRFNIFIVRCLGGYFFPDKLHIRAPAGAAIREMRVMLELFDSGDILCQFWLVFCDLLFLG